MSNRVAPRPCSRSTVCNGATGSRSCVSTHRGSSSPCWGRGVSAPDGWYRSGDLARKDEDGFLFIVDREKDMIITGGENVYSKEVEDALLAHPGVRDVAVIGRPHAEWGETVVAVVVPQAGGALDPESLGDFLATRLARYKIPRDYLMCEGLPRTPTGKLMKHVVRTMVKDGART
jgi:feruloyl-CoA synthase